MKERKMMLNRKIETDKEKNPMLKENKENVARLKKLKQKICAVAGNRTRVFSYSALPSVGSTQKPPPLPYFVTVYSLGIRAVYKYFCKERILIKIQQQWLPKLVARKLDFSKLIKKSEIDRFQK